jgi:hypothetical protein
MTDFQWTDELVKELVRGTFNYGVSLDEAVEKFKQSKLSKPKEFEILRCFDEDSSYTHEYISKELQNKEQLITNCDDEKCKIYSVKRLSDNEVFSVGDKVEWGKLYTIKRLFVSDNGLMWCDLVSEKGKEYHNVNFGALDKIKTPLFVTDDGIKVFDENQTIHGVLTDFWIKVSYTPHLASMFKEHGKWFSSEEKRDQYILMNKPLLSLQEIFKQTAIVGMACVEMERILTDVAKQKLSDSNGTETLS